MASSLRKLILLLLLALATALVVAACGSGSETKSVPAGAIALVGDKAIPKSDLDSLLDATQKNYETNKQEFPSVGTPEYEDLKSKLVSGLVKQAQWEQAGAAMGIKVTDKEVETQLVAFKQQYFKGDEEKYKAELEKQGLTDQEVRDRVHRKLFSDKIYNSIIGRLKATDAEIKAYYNAHKDQYAQPESREVRHILVKSKSLAGRLYNQIKGGADFAKLALKNSQDTGSAKEGGKLTAYKGKTVAPFDKFVFDAKTGDLSRPIKTEFGWHIIEVLSDVKPAATQPLSEVRDSISGAILQEEQTQALNKWTVDANAKYQVTYAPGYAPGPTATTTG